MRAFRIGAVIAVMAIFSAGDAHAQSIPQERKGFWIGVGLGAGSLGCDGCTDRETGYSGHFSLGGTLNQRVQLGAMSNGWVKDENGVGLTVGTLSAIVKFYPNAQGGFYLLGGLGVSRVDLSIDGIGSDSDDGAAAVIGLGYDARVGRNFSLTPYLHAIGMNSEREKTNLMQVGLSLSWH